MKIERLIVDVDGCLTDGTFLWTGEKFAKTFGPDDWDAMRDLAQQISAVILVTSDEVGWNITKSRAAHAWLHCDLVSGGDERARYLAYISESGEYPIAYVGDSYTDVPALEYATLGFAPANAHPAAKLAADVVLPRRGGDRAVALACAYVASGRRPRGVGLRRALRAVRVRTGRDRRYV